MSKKLSTITVSHAPDKVGVTFKYEDAPDDSMLLPLKVAQDFFDRLAEALVLARQPQATGDGVGLNDSSKVSIV